MIEPFSGRGGFDIASRFSFLRLNWHNSEQVTGL
jgi:hypothetical protein